jgi:hypothetical protein
VGPGGRRPGLRCLRTAPSHASMPRPAVPPSASRCSRCCHRPSAPPLAPDAGKAFQRQESDLQVVAGGTSDSGVPPQAQQEQPQLKGQGSTAQRAAVAAAELESAAGEEYLGWVGQGRGCCCSAAASCCGCCCCGPGCSYSWRPRQLGPPVLLLLMPTPSLQLRAQPATQSTYTTEGPSQPPAALARSPRCYLPTPAQLPGHRGGHGAGGQQGGGCGGRRQGRAGGWGATARRGAMLAQHQALLLLCIRRRAMLPEAAVLCRDDAGPAP